MCVGCENGEGIWLGIWPGWGGWPEQTTQPETCLQGWGSAGEIFKEWEVPGRNKNINVFINFVQNLYSSSDECSEAVLQGKWVCC